jgi:two-component system sensor histidine kinase YesM
MLFSTNSGFEISDGFGAETDRKIRSILENKLQQSNHDAFHVEIREIPYLAIYAKSDYLDMVLCKYIPENQVFASLKKYHITFWVFTLAALIIITLFTFSTNRFINRPLSKLVNSFREVEGGNLEIRIRHDHNDEFGYLYKRFNAMVENLDVLIHQVYKQKILAQKAELKHLQSQINPHFLYNSFFSLHNMVVNGDYENVELFTRQLGTYFQFVTRSAADVIPLEKEVAHARIYADIQSRRFRNRIKLEFEDLPEELRNIPVPRLIVQPLIENAFEHGLKNTVSDGLLRVTFTSGDGRLVISVEDNGKEMSGAEIERLEGCLKQENDCAHPAANTIILLWRSFYLCR